MIIQCSESRAESRAGHDFVIVVVDDGINYFEEQTIEQIVGTVPVVDVS